MTEVPARAALVFDGVFLLREEIRRFWTLAVYLAVPPQETVRRALVRDAESFGSGAEVERRYARRYLPGQALYREESSPESFAHVVVDNVDPLNPTVIRWSTPTGQ